MNTLRPRYNHNKDLTNSSNIETYICGDWENSLAYGVKVLIIHKGHDGEQGVHLLDLKCNKIGYKGMREFPGTDLDS